VALFAGVTPDAKADCVTGSIIGGFGHGIGYDRLTSYLISKISSDRVASDEYEWNQLADEIVVWRFINRQ